MLRNAADPPTLYYYRTNETRQLDGRFRAAAKELDVSQENWSERLNSTILSQNQEPLTSGTGGGITGSCRLAKRVKIKKKN